MVIDAYKDCDGDHKAFRELIGQTEKLLYPKCTKFTKFGILVKSLNIKGKFGWFDSSFTTLLRFLKELLHKRNEIPKSVHDAKKKMSILDL